MTPLLVLRTGNWQVGGHLRGHVKMIPGVQASFHQIPTKIFRSKEQDDV